MPSERSSLRATERRRLVIGYVVLGAAVAAVMGGSLFFGARLSPPAPGSTVQVEAPAAGSYEVRTDAASCFPTEERDRQFELRQESGAFTFEISDSAFPASWDGDRLNATVGCPAGGTADLSVRAVRQVAWTALVGTLRGADFAAVTRPLSGEETFGRLMLAISIAILVARVLGALVARVGQPRVMGEVLGGIILGPSLVGMLFPQMQAFVFPPQIVPLLGGAADIGLAFYMFLIGLELNPGLLRGRIAQAAFISNTSVLVPMALGSALALVLFPQFGVGDFLPFALFMGVAMSITAFPVLARILTERRMLRRPVGATGLAAAAIDDVSAWTLLALASAAAVSTSATGAVQVILLAALFAGAMFLLGRPLLRRVGVAYDEVGMLPQVWLGIVFIGVLMSAYLASAIGVAAIFGAFIMGMIMPRRADLTRDLTERIESFVVIILLPLFFVVTGLRTEVGLLDRWELWAITLGIIVVAVVAKWGSAMLASRFVGWRTRDAAAIGALMNTRGLTELIVLNIGLDLGVIGQEVFAMLVLMALATTLMTGPALRILDPRGELSAPPGEEADIALTDARQVSDETQRQGSVLVAPQDVKNVDALLTIAEPAARAGSGREIILALLLPSSSLSAGVERDEARQRTASLDLERRRSLLTARGMTSGAVTYISPGFAPDLIRLTTQHPVDLLVVDGQRPLVGEPVPRGPILSILANVPCDVAVVIDRPKTAPQAGSDAPIVVPFGGADHDWAALEIAALVAGSTGAPMKLVGASSSADDGRDAGKLLASAAKAVHQLSGVRVEPVLVEPGAQSILSVAEGARLLVVGLSDRWREEGLGEVRAFVARNASAPTAFVRSGGKRSFLRTTSGATQMAWSQVAGTDALASGAHSAPIVRVPRVQSPREATS
ncbi:MAG: cation:proton antiporter [Candidatus Limnocylindria bacterium]